MSIGPSLVGQSLGKWAAKTSSRGARWAGVDRGGALGRTEGELTFYFSARGRDLRHTQVGGGHDVIVGKAVPRTGDREGLNRGKIEDTAHPAGNGFGCPSPGVPVFTLDISLRPGHPREEESGNKVLLKPPQVETRPFHNHQHHYQANTGLTARMSLGTLQVTGRRQEATQGARPPDPGRARCQELKKYPDPGENQVTRKTLPPRPQS